MLSRFVLILTVLNVFSAASSASENFACDCMETHAVVMSLPSTGGFMGSQPIYKGFHDARLYIPPGTIGETYTRTSHRIPVDKHPRTGMLAVRDNNAAKFMSVEKMGGFRMKSGVWLFESDRPLEPGVSQIVRVEARHTSNDVEPHATRFVRLIPGRIVYLDF